MMRAPLMLHPKVELRPVADLPPHLRDLLDARDGDHALRRAGGRAHDKVVSAEVAALLRRFETAETPIAAIIRHARAAGSDPEQLIDAVWPLLTQLAHEGILLPPDDVKDGEPEVVDAGPDGPPLHDLELVRSMDESAVWRARLADGAKVAIKVVLRRDPMIDAAFGREARALRRLNGAPRLHHVGATLAGQPVLIMDWIDGVPLHQAVTASHEAGDREATLRLVRATAHAYSRLHQVGVLHGDVHPGNLLVDRAEEVVVIDFGFAALPGDEASTPRAGVTAHLDPDLAAAQLAGTRPPPPNAADEQYAVATLLWQMATGLPPFDVPIEREAALRRLSAAGPTSFAKRGVAPWPALEAVLTRALAREPDARFPSMAAFAAALDHVEPTPAPPAQDPVAPAIARVRDLGRPNGFRVPPGSRCGVAHGGGGAPWALYRLSAAMDRPDLLHEAEQWQHALSAVADDDDAWLDPSEPADQRSRPGGSIWHDRSGHHYMTATLTNATGRADACRAAVSAFARSVDPHAAPEVGLGVGGALLGAASLYELVAGRDPVAQSELDAVGRRLDGILQKAVEAWTRDPATLPLLGMAHGRAGVLAARLRWTQATGSPAPPDLIDALDAQATLGRTEGRGRVWPTDTRSEATMPGWCHGHAGHTLLWSLAARVTELDRYRALTEEAAWSTWDQAGGPPQVCCGRCGQAWALHRAGCALGDPRWTDRARILLGGARAETTEYPDSVYKGRLGPAVLAAELDSGRESGFPLVDGEP